MASLSFFFSLKGDLGGGGRAGETVQWIKHLLCKSGNQGESGSPEPTCNPSSELVDIRSQESCLARLAER